MKYLIVMLNGPAGSGKDSIANHMLEIGHPYRENPNHSGMMMTMHNKLSHPMKYFVMECFNVSQYDMETKKERTDVLPNNVSIREAQINMFRDYLAPTFGPGILGYLFSRRIRDDLSRHYHHFPGTIPLFVVSDCGRTAEFLEVCKQHDGHVHLLMINRPGYTFGGDIREYVREVPPNVPHEVIFNNGSLSNLHSKATDIIEGWFDRHVNGIQYSDTNTGVHSESADVEPTR